MLAIATGTRCRRFVVEERYAPAGESGRVFRLTRVGGIGDDHDVELMTDRRLSTCSCAGHSYEASEKANRRAAERGDAVVATLGCAHLDAIAYAIDSGWLPDPRANAEQDVGSTVTADELEEMGSAASNGASGAWFPEDRLPEWFGVYAGGESKDVPF